ncbi:MAG TPA: S4 domain-containing protein [Candidatus Acidoferrales bacterium]
MLERLQKIIARAGIASRRHAEELIASGLVTVNGHTITELGSKADETKDHIKVQGKLLQPETERAYLILNKPPEVVSTMSDPEGRRCLRDLLHGVSLRVFPVGRLEYHSMGLVFLTNDGELANQMLKAHYLPQTYNLKLKTLLTFEEVETLSRLTGAHIIRIKGKESPWYEVTLSEARRDELRNRLFQTGHPVEKIKRVKIGNIAMESLTPGAYRPLSDAEVATLRKMLDPKNAVQAVAASAGPIQEKLGEKGENKSPAQFTTERRPFIKKRPYQPKPKPGEHRPQQNQPPIAEPDGNRLSVPLPPRQANASFAAGRPTNQFRPSPKPFGKPNMDRPPQGGKQFSGGKYSGAPRPGFDSKPPQGSRPPFRPNDGNNRPGNDRPNFRSNFKSGGQQGNRPYSKPYSNSQQGGGKPPFRPNDGGNFGKGKPGGINHGRRDFMGSRAGTPQSASPDAPPKPPRSFPSRTEGSAKWGPNERVYHKPPAEEFTPQKFERPAKPEFAAAPSRPMFDEIKPGQTSSGQSTGEQPQFRKSFTKPGFSKPGFSKPASGKSGFSKPKSDRPWVKKAGASSGKFDKPRGTFKPRSSDGPREARASSRPSAPFRGKSKSEPGAFGRVNKTARPKTFGSGKPSAGKPRGAKPGGGKVSGGKRPPSGGRPKSRSGGGPRPKGRG